MLEYTLDLVTRSQIGTNEPAVKAALCVIANAKFGTDTPISGVYRAEGGIVVNGRDIRISDNVIEDVAYKDANPTAEEQATLQAIQEVQTIIENEGIQTLQSKYGTCEKGNPLKALITGDHMNCIL